MTLSSKRYSDNNLKSKSKSKSYRSCVHIGLNIIGVCDVHDNRYDEVEIKQNMKFSGCSSLYSKLTRTSANKFSLVGPNAGGAILVLAVDIIT